MNSIQKKIVLLVIFSIIIVSSILSIVVMRDTRTAFDQETLNKLEEMAIRYASEFNNELIRVEEKALNVELLVETLFSFDALKNNPNYLDEFELKIAPVIKGIAEQGVRTQSAYVFFLPDLDGQAHDVWYSDLDYEGVVKRQEEFTIDYYDTFIPGREWFFVPKETGEVYWTDPYLGNAYYDDHIIYVSHTRPAFVDGQLVGIVGSDYHFNLMIDDIENIQLSEEEGYAFLLNETADILVHPSLEKFENLDTYKDGKYANINEQFFKNESGIYEYKWEDNQDKIMVFTHLNNGWIFGLTLNTDVVFGWVSDVRIKLAIIIIISVLIVSIIGYQVGAIMTKPLVELTSHVKVIGDGDYNFIVPNRLLTQKDETGKLAKSIETMRQLQKESYEHILNHNETLESEIQNRTDSLVKKHQELKQSLSENELKTQELILVNEKLEHAIEDMTATQRQLIESEKIASLSFLVSRLAHEFNTPIGNFTTLLSYLFDEQLKIKKGLEEGILKKEDLLKFLNKYDESNTMMMENLTRIKLLVNRYKDLDPSTHVTLNSRINVHNFIEIVIDSLEYDNEAIGIEILCEPDLEIDIDAGKLSQIIMHLLDNALRHGFRDYMSGMIIIDVKQEEGQLIMRIEDNGRGMATDTIKHIFVPFYTGSLNAESSGLGLNIVYNIVTELFDGEITCNSFENEGTEFVIVIKL